MGGFHLFSIRGIPVSVSLWFFIILFFLVRGDLRSGLIWAGAITFSILIHELGHAFVAKRFRLNPSITLHGWGGLTHHERAETNRHDALIIAAGPGAGILLGLLVLVGSYGLEAAAPVVAARPLVQSTIRALLFVNFFWSFVNLLPLWPLDGGQLFRLAMVHFLSPAKGERVTHIVGTITGLFGVWAGWSLMGSMFVAIIAGLLTFQNVRNLNSSSASGPIRLSNTFAKNLLKEARAKFDEGDYREAARLCHQIRAEKNLDSGTLAEVWKILSVSTVALGEYEEAMSYLKRAKLSGEVYDAKVRAVLELGRTEEAQALLDHPEAKRIPEGARAALEELTRSEKAS